MLKNIFRENKILKNNSKGRHAIQGVTKEERTFIFQAKKKHLSFLQKNITN